MLVLTRKPGEAIYVGDVRIVLVEINKGRARIGIEAPKSYVIAREELLTKTPEGK